jgi:hypothetical protein
MQKAWEGREGDVGGKGTEDVGENK